MTLRQPSRIGLLGGAFDPPHNAHVALAQCALNQLTLDALHIVPTGDAWHKARSLTAAAHRLAMTRLAFAALPRVVVDPREICRAGPSYSIDTLHELRAVYPDATLFLLVGADQAQAFQTWHRWADILLLATVVVAARPLSASDQTSEPSRQWHNAVSPDVQRLDMPSLNVSATDIRAQLAQAIPHAAARHLPATVQHYIEQHRLYQSTL